jgi:hypothetical protein
MGQLYEIGTQLYVQEDGKAGGPAVVFIHGITLDIRVWSARYLRSVSIFALYDMTCVDSVGPRIQNGLIKIGLIWKPCLTRSKFQLPSLLACRGVDE